QTIELMTGAGVGRSARGDHDQRAAHHGAHQNSVVSLATVSLLRIRALIESAAFIARPTARALGIFELARMLSFWRSVSVSRSTVWLDLSEPPHAAMQQSETTQRMDFMRLATSSAARPP